MHLAGNAWFDWCQSHLNELTLSTSSDSGASNARRQTNWAGFRSCLTGLISPIARRFETAHSVFCMQNLVSNRTVCPSFSHERWSFLFCVLCSDSKQPTDLEINNRFWAMPSISRTQGQTEKPQSAKPATLLARPVYPGNQDKSQHHRSPHSDWASSKQTWPQRNAGALFWIQKRVNPIPSIQIHGESTSRAHALQHWSRDTSVHRLLTSPWHARTHAPDLRVGFLSPTHVAWALELWTQSHL